MRSTLSSGTRVQYTQPPNGSLNGMPSISTSDRLTPLGPMPRSDTPCAVGCDDRLLVRRNRLKVGTRRSTSSATDGRRLADLFLVDHADAGRHVAQPLLGAGRRHGHRLEEGGRREHDLEGRLADGRLRLLGESAGADHDGGARRDGAEARTVRRDRSRSAVRHPEEPRATTAAPETTPPDASLTTPETADWADADSGEYQQEREQRAVRMTRK